MIAVSHRIEALWEELSRPLRAFFARAGHAEEAEDLLQECFLRVVRGIDDVQDDDRLAAWVQRIARNLVVDAHRRGRRPGEPVEELAAEYHAEDLNRVVGGWIADRIHGLPERYREAVRLYELEGVAQRAIAERLGLSLPAVKSRVQRGRSLLRSDLLACCSFEFDRTGGVVDVRRRADPDCDC